uniref:Uncharacterized protein n=1 Tax=Zea mays TaxID=4577 RepID=C0HFT7_MAIZE|nr:unknown [Zea mays]
MRHSSESGLSLQYFSSGSLALVSLRLSRAWLAVALSSSTSSHAAAHSASPFWSSAHVSSACLMLSDTLSEISGGVAGPLDRTATNRPPPRRAAAGNQTTRLAPALLGTTISTSPPPAAAKVVVVTGTERLATVDAAIIIPVLASL